MEEAEVEKRGSWGPFWPQREAINEPSIYLLVETAPPLSRSVLPRSSSQISPIYPDRSTDNERESEAGVAASRATVHGREFPQFRG